MVIEAVGMDEGESTVRDGKGLGISLEEHEHFAGEGDPAEKPEEEIKELRDKPGEYSVQGGKEASVFVFFFF